MDHIFITYQHALAILAQHKVTFGHRILPLHECTGAYLAEDLVADRDFPPFDRVTMDGIAIAFESFEKGNREFTIEATAQAGKPQKTLKDRRNCIEVMTGAIMPKGADTVIRYEDLLMANGKATLTITTLKKAQNLHFKGIDMDKGTCLVTKGKPLSSAEISIAASVGKTHLKTVQLPKTVVVSTGDELVEVDQMPKTHQIRRSNVYGIKNTLQEWGLAADLEHLPDEPKRMHQRIEQLLKEYTLLIFSGGVSKGKFDYLPNVLETLEVQRQFHQIQQKPGKPFWFGTSPSNAKIFALPGNPVSSFVCVYLYVHYWLNVSLGQEMAQLYVKLGAEVIFTPDLTYFLEAKLSSLPNGTLVAMPVTGNGSGDFANLVKADGFLILPQGKSIFSPGEVYPFIPYRKMW